ncbi:putative glycosidase CRH2 [Coemansia aciculifera]|uniref:Glycosidase CRH2 n=1 Tax=Coemansia aciculifera TaxID=417176 RepID=A0ACC1M8T6_9FUNG|nr:putative glycosidase CRH2 [Coemansia aciculifera]
MKVPVLVGAASLLLGHALGACTGMNAADRGMCPTDQCLALNEDFSLASALGNVASSNATFISEQQPDNASVNDGSLTLLLKQWIHYGTITALVRSGSTAPGVVSSLQLQDSVGSSIDMDWVGISSNRVQANYYTYSQLELSQAVAPILPTDPTQEFIEYKIVWLPNSLTWYANGLAVRTVNRRDTWAEGEQRFHYPDQPARLSFSIWDSADSINPGLTQAWAGVMQPYSAGTQFAMSVTSVSVQCYSNASLPVPHDTNPAASALSSPSPSPNTATASISSTDLSNFGLGSEQISSAGNSGSLEATSSTPDDLSKWLAGITSSASQPNQSLGTIAYICIALGIAVFSSL